MERADQGQTPIEIAAEIAVDIVIATRNRADVLEGTLDAIAASREAPSWRILVVDNGSTDETPALLARAAARLPLVMLHEPERGKSRALNRALARVAGELVLFTDDDVRVARGWMAALHRASRVHADASVFCGPIVPEFPPETPGWLRASRFAAPAFGDFRPDLPEGPLPPPLLPFGGNFAVRRRALAGQRFRVELGPSSRGALMCEDIDFLDALRRQGHAFVFVPDASLRHLVRPELTAIPNLLERAFNLGRSEILRARPATAGEAPALPPAALLRDPFEIGCVVSFALGQLRELSSAPAPAVDAALERRAALIAWIAASAWTGASGSIARSADDWLRTQPDALPPALAARLRPSPPPISSRPSSPW